MKIQHRQFIEGAAKARHSAVIIDVFRAWTCSSYLLHCGVERIVLEQDPARALELKRKYNWLALGEVNGIKIKGFDLGNSPTEIIAAGESKLAGQTVLQRTSAGVRGAFAAADGCEYVYAGAYTTASALARVLLAQDRPEINLVAMGWNGVESIPEDERCADYIHSLLDPSFPYDHTAALSEILSHESAQKFLRGDKSHFPRTDVTWCLQRDLFPWAIRVIRTDNGLELQKVFPPA